MNDSCISRRAVLAGGASAALAAALNPSARADTPTTTPTTAPSPGFRFSLNTSTISGANLGIVKELEIASAAGYSAVEPWMHELHAYEKKGGSIADLRKRFDDLGLVLADVIGFPEWIVDDEAKRAKSLEQLKRDMDLIAQLGGKHIAAPPAGADGPIDLDVIAQRYRAILELGQQTGVAPVLEFWGSSKTLWKLSQVAYVSIQSHRPDATMLLDIFHLYKGASDFDGLRQINGAALPVLHVNDYPADPPRERITDGSRIYPGDGIAPYDAILRDLRSIRFAGYLSLELFNKDYWRQSPAKVAQAGIEKLKALVAKV